MKIAVNFGDFIFFFLSTKGILIKILWQITKRKFWCLLEENDKHIFFTSFDYVNNVSFLRSRGTTLRNSFEKTLSMDVPLREWLASDDGT